MSPAWIQMNSNGWRRSAHKILQLSLTNSSKLSQNAHNLANRFRSLSWPAISYPLRRLLHSRLLTQKFWLMLADSKVLTFDLNARMLYLNVWLWMSESNESNGWLRYHTQILECIAGFSQPDPADPALIARLAIGHQFCARRSVAVNPLVTEWISRDF